MDRVSTGGRAAAAAQGTDGSRRSPEAAAGRGRPGAALAGALAATVMMPIIAPKSAMRL